MDNVAKAHGIETRNLRRDSKGGVDLELNNKIQQKQDAYFKANQAISDLAIHSGLNEAVDYLSSKLSEFVKFFPQDEIENIKNNFTSSMAEWGICDYCNEAYEYPEGYAVCKCNELHGEQQ